MLRNSALVLVGLLAMFNLAPQALPSAVNQVGKQEPKLPPPQPVEKSMHEFMEYLFEPAYLRLKDSMALQPKKPAAEQPKKNWKAIKGDALTLAESANLLLARLPDKDAAAWANHAFAVREAGSQLYQAAKKKDEQTAVSAYKTMLTKCNACHKQFAEGKHQLEP